MSCPLLLRRLATGIAAAAAIVVPLLAVTAAPAAAASNTSGPAFGVQFHGMWSDYTDAQRQQILDQMKAAGVHWIRLDLSWAMLQPDGPGSHDMGWGVPFADRVIDMIHADGFHLLVTFWRTPAWANGGAGETTLPTDPATYADGIQWASQRYAGKVEAWEVWNEPNQTWSMQGASPRAYTSLLQAAYPAVHAGDPTAQVVFGGPSENDAPWISKAYAAGAHGYFDVMATHPYLGPSNDPPATPDDGTIYKLTHVAAVHRLMAEHGDGDKPIWFTEFGWSSHANTAAMQNWELGVSRQKQGEYLVQALQVIKDQFSYVTNAFWYEASDEQTGTTENNDNYGLLDSSLTPKPAYDAVRTYLTGSAATPATATTTSQQPAPETATTTSAQPTGHLVAPARRLPGVGHPRRSGSVALVHPTRHWWRSRLGQEIGRAGQPRHATNHRRPGPGAGAAKYRPVRHRAVLRAAQRHRPAASSRTRSVNVFWEAWTSRWRVAWSRAARPC